MKWQFETENSQAVVPQLYPIPLAPAARRQPTDVLDYHELMERMGYDRQLLREVVGLFQEDAPARLRELENSLARMDSLGFERAAHALKGMLASLSAKPAASTAYSLENLGHSGQWWNADQLLSHLAEQIDVLNTRLDLITKEVAS